MLLCDAVIWALLLSAPLKLRPYGALQICLLLLLLLLILSGHLLFFSFSGVIFWHITHELCTKLRNKSDIEIFGLCIMLVSDKFIGSKNQKGKTCCDVLNALAFQNMKGYGKSARYLLSVNYIYTYIWTAKVKKECRAVSTFAARYFLLS